MVLAFAVPDLRAKDPVTTVADPDTADESPTKQRIALRLSDLSRPELRRVLIVAGLLGLVTVGDGFIYLALSDRGSVAATYFRCCSSAPTSPTSPWPSRSASSRTGSVAASCSSAGTRCCSAST